MLYLEGLDAAVILVGLTLLCCDEWGLLFSESVVSWIAAASEDSLAPLGASLVFLLLCFFAIRSDDLTVRPSLILYLVSASLNPADKNSNSYLRKVQDLCYAITIIQQHLIIYVYQLTIADLVTW